MNRKGKKQSLRKTSKGSTISSTKKNRQQEIPSKVKANNMQLSSVNNSKEVKPKITTTKNKDGSVTKTYLQEDPLKKTLRQSQFTKYPDGYSFSQEVKNPGSYTMIKKEFHHRVASTI
jgi:hypothetical protein